MTDPSKMSREDTAFFIRAMWSALLAPKWLRDDLIELGKAVFAKEALSTMDDALFARLVPHLTEMATVLGSQVAKKIANDGKASQPSAPPAPAPAATPVEKEEKDG